MPAKKRATTKKTPLSKKPATKTNSSFTANQLTNSRFGLWPIILTIVGVIILGYIIFASRAATVGNYPATATIPKVAPYTSFWWQLENTPKATGLSGEPNPKKHYDFDFEDVTAAQVSTIKSQGAIATCYFEVGTAATWRDDYAQFPAAAISASDPQNWGDERWIDINNATVRNIMADRMDRSKAKGCQGIEPDWLDNYTYTQAEYDSTGKVKVPTKVQQLDYMKFLADEAHKRGMMIALKNVPELATEKFADGRVVADVYDWALIEECTVSYASTCPNLKAFIDRGKNVTVAEYNDQVSQTKFTNTLCAQFSTWNFDGYLFDRKNGGSPTLTGNFRVPCRTGQGQTAVPTTTVTVFPGGSTTTVTSTVTTQPPTGDTSKPVGPSSVTATTVSGTQINLSWPAATDNVGVKNYIVKRNGTQIATPTTTSFNDTGLSPSTTFTYAVTAIDAAGNVSTGASTQARTLVAPTDPPPPPTSDTTPPSAPTNIKAAYIFDLGRWAYGATVSWAAAKDNVGVKDYIVSRNGVQVSTVTALSYSDFTASVNSTYTFTVAARDAAGNVGPASTVKFTGRCFLVWCWVE